MKWLVCMLAVLVWLDAKEVLLEPVTVQSGNLETTDTVLSIEEARNYSDVTLQERLERDVSLNADVDGKGEATISFRGLSHKATRYYEDGIPLYRSVNGMVDTNLWMSRASIRFNDGSGTGEYGVSAMGGEVVLSTPGVKKSIEGEIEGHLSQNDEYGRAYIGGKTDSAYVQIDGGVYHRDDFVLSDNYDATALQGSGKRINSDRTLNSVSIKNGFRPNGSTHLAWKASFTTSEYGLPPNVYTNLASPVWDAYTRIDNKEVGSLYLYGDYKHGDYELSARGYADSYEDQWVIYNEPAYETNWPVMTYDDSRLGMIVKATKSSDSHRHSAVFNYERNEHHAKEAGASSHPRFASDTYKGSYIYQWKQQYGWNLDSALSYTMMKLVHGDYAGGIHADDKKGLDAQLKLDYKNKEWSAYGAVAHKNRMPSLNEMSTFFAWEVSNPALKPEQSMQYTLGYKRWIGSESVVEASLFHYDVEDLILYRNNGYINREEATHHGVELKLESEAYANHQLRMAYAYTDAKDSQNEPLELLPNHRFKAEDLMTFNREWKGFVSYHFIGSRSSANTATYTDEQKKLSPYHLAGVQLRYVPTKRFSVRAGVKNLLDEQYEPRYGYPAAGRSFYVSMEIKLP